MPDIEFYRRVVELLEQGKTFVIAHLVNRRGSAPNDPGSKMIILENGMTEFTIGGGPFEATVREDGLACLREGNRLKDYGLVYQEMGMRCGGRAMIYFEVMQPRIPLWIFGSGHVGQALSKFSADTGFFSITVIDDRPSMLERIKTAHTLLTDHTYEKGWEKPPDGAYVAIVTRCHDVDEKVLKKMVQFRNLNYLGMIGSRTKVHSLFRKLMQEGVDKRILQAVDAPIGLSIGGKSPTEVALSILARLIQVKNGLFPRFCDQVEEAWIGNHRSDAEDNEQIKTGNSGVSVLGDG